MAYCHVVDALANLSAMSANPQVTGTYYRKTKLPAPSSDKAVVITSLIVATSRYTVNTLVPGYVVLTTLRVMNYVQRLVDKCVHTHAVQDHVQRLARRARNLAHG